MLPPTLNQSTVLPSALVVYSHHLLGNAIKTALVRYGVEVVLAPLKNTPPVNIVGNYTYIIFVIAGQNDYNEIREVLGDVFTRLSTETKLSVVVSEAQSGLISTNRIATANLQEFDHTQIQKTFLTLNQSTQHNTKSQLVFIEDLVDFSSNDSLLNPLQALVRDVASNQVNLIGSPEQVYHPLSSSQAAEVVVRELFVLRHKQQIIGVRGKQETTLLKLAYEVKRILLENSPEDPSFISLFSDSRFAPSDKSIEYLNPSSTLKLNEILKKIWLQPAPVDQVLVPQIKEMPIPMEIAKSSPIPHSSLVVSTPQPQLFVGNQIGQKIVSKPKQIISPKPFKIISPAPKRITPLKKRTKKSGLLVGMATLLFVSAVLVWLALPFLRYSSIATALTKPTQSDANNAPVLANLTRAQERITVYFSVISRFTPASLDDHLFNLNERLKLSTNKLVLQAHLNSLNQKLSDLLSKNLNLTDGDVYQSSIELAQIAQQNYQELTTLELGFKQSHQSALLEREPEFSEAKLKTLKNSLKKLQNGLESLPYILPANQSTNMLVLIQNSHELRATGGFIESVGLLRFNSGKLLSSEFRSSYELDELLNGTVEPPGDLRQFLGENQWYSRDANWDPDFVSAAKNTAWFYEKQTNNKVDVVVALTVPALSELLDAVDGVTLADGVILDDSSISSWLTEAQKKLSGEQTTQALLGPVVELIFKKIQTPNQVDLFRVAQALGTSLENAEMLVAGVKPEINASLASLGWTGTVLSPVCPAVLSQAQCVVDTLYVNESNVGVNSANAQVSRTQTHTVSFQSDKIVHTHQTNFVHSGQNNTWPGGVYQNYLRYYLPQNARFIKAIQDGAIIDDADIIQNQAQDKNLIGFLIRIQPNSSSQVVIEYDELNPIPPQNALTYAFLMQKQPGIIQAPLSLILNYPPGYSLKRVSHPYALSDNHLMVNDSLAKHFFLAVELNP